MTNTKDQKEDTPEISATAVKLPSFWVSTPSAWFVQAEMQFSLRQIVQDRTKFEYIVTALPQDVVLSVLDVIQSPPATNQYETLKKALISRHSMSEEQKLEKLLSNSVMGDRKPSEFLRYLETLAGPSGPFNKEILNQLWMRRLPQYLSIPLMATGKTNAADLTPIADRIWEMSQNNNNVSSIASCSQASANIGSVSDKAMQQLAVVLQNLNSNLEAVKAEVAEMRSTVYRDSGRARSRSRSRKFYRNSNRSRNRSRSSAIAKNKPFCWYHYKFGERANRCTQPCEFSSSTISGNNSKNL